MEHSMYRSLIGKYQFTLKGGWKKFQIVPKEDEKKYKMTTKSGKSIYLQALIDIQKGYPSHLLLE